MNQRIRKPSFIIGAVVTVTVLVILYFVSVVAMGLVLMGVVGGLLVLTVPANLKFLLGMVKGVDDYPPPNSTRRGD